MPETDVFLIAAFNDAPNQIDGLLQMERHRFGSRTRLLDWRKIAESLSDADYDQKVGFATGIPAPGLMVECREAS